MGQTKKTGKKGGRSKNNRSSSAKGNAKKQPTQENHFHIRKEAFLLLGFAFCMFLFAALFNVGGKIGGFFVHILFGLFGISAYVIPVLIFATIISVLRSGQDNKGGKKIIWVWLLLLCATAFLQLAMIGHDGKLSPGIWYTFSSKHHTGGGMIGGLLGGLLGELLGIVGAYIALVAVAAVCVVLITERSMIQPIRTGSQKAYTDARGHMEKKKEERRRRKEQRMQMTQAEKPVMPMTGVSFETKLKWPDESQGAFMEDPLASLKAEEEIERVSVSDMPAEAGHIQMANMSSLAVSNTDLKAGFAETAIGADSDFFHSNIAVHDAQEDAKADITESEWEDPTLLRSHSVSSQTDSIEEEKERSADMVSRKKKNFLKEESLQQLTEQVEEQIEEQIGVQNEVKHARSTDSYVYRTPPIDLLVRGSSKAADNRQHLQQTAQKLEQTLANFGVNVRVTDASCGPSVTRYELQPEMGVKVSRIVSLADDIKLNLAVADLRIEAPIPGKAAVGIEIPNKENSPVMLRELLESSEFHKMPSGLAFAVGKDIAGKTMVADIAKMPHLLVAGATGSGKSVCINTLIMSLIYKSSPEDVKLIMVDPKMVELSVYNGIPHLLIPVVTDPKKAAGALNWAVAEMMKRYKLFSEYNVRDLKGFNTLSSRMGEEAPPKMPQIVIIVDELADLMMVAPQEVEGAICRLAQLARAAGIHLIIATQRPSVNVITGLIKANMPSRIAFAVSSGVDSRTIIDMNGAEKLLGRGDMLFSPSNLPKPVRVQGAFVSDKEVFDVVQYLKESHGEASYSNELEQEMINHTQTAAGVGSTDGGAADDDRDVYFEDAAWAIIEKDRASIGMLQRLFKIGFNRAARIMDQLTEAGVVGPEEGTKPRKLLMTKEQFGQYINGEREVEEDGGE